MRRRRRPHRRTRSKSYVQVNDDEDVDNDDDDEDDDDDDNDDGDDDDNGDDGDWLARGHMGLLLLLLLRKNDESAQTKLHPPIISLISTHIQMFPILHLSIFLITRRMWSCLSRWACYYPTR